MECGVFSPEHLPILTRLLNAQLAAIPPAWSLTEAHVAHTIGLASRLWDVHFPEQIAAFELETLCVLDQGQLVAAAQWGYPIQQESHGIDNSSLLFWVVAEPESMKGPQLLLETIAAKSQAAGSPRITTGRFSFGVGWLGIPAAWHPVVQALQAVGFVSRSRWAILTGATDIPAVNHPEPVEKMDISWQVDINTAEWELRLLAEGGLVGECQAWGIPQHFSGCKGYSNWITIEWLGVEPAFQRKGIGRWLLVEQLRRQAQRGITRAILWTETSNQPILGLCRSLGFHVGPACWDYEKTWR